jgi:hypothetical protein
MDFSDSEGAAGEARTTKLKQIRDEMRARYDRMLNGQRDTFEMTALRLWADDLDALVRREDERT